jgi:hypothetical protein
MALPQAVKIVEVGPRDGLQNEKEFVPTAVKIELINRLSAAGFRNVESASFVSPKWVPQMADGAEVMAGIERRPGTIYSVLTPNLRGFEGALAARADEIVIFGAASEAFSQKNINCSIAESIARFEPVAQAAREHGLRIRGSVSCTLGCPYQGEVPVSSVVDVVERFAALGCDEIDIADTIGVGTPKRTREVFAAVTQVFPRHLWPGARQHLRRAAGRHRDFSCVGRGSRRLPICEGRHRQCRNRRRAVSDERPRHRNRYRSRAGRRNRRFHFEFDRQAKRLAGWQSLARESSQRTRLVRLTPAPLETA